MSSVPPLQEDRAVDPTRSRASEYALAAEFSPVTKDRTMY